MKKIFEKSIKFTWSNIHNYKNNQIYSSWLKKRSKEITNETLGSLRVSIVVPTYNTPEQFFREMVESVLRQSYNNWELVMVDDCSPDTRVRDLIKEYAAKDKRIKHKFLTKNHHISGATNEGIKLAKGEFIALLDHDDLLHHDALLEMAKALEDNQNLDFIYTDEDKVDERGRRMQPFLKPDWNPDFMHSVNYITHFTAIRKSALDKFGYEDSNYNGAQDWELFLRITRNIPQENIHHIPKILYSWRVHAASTAQDMEAKPYVVESQRRAIKDDLKARGYTDVQIRRDAVYSGQWHLKFNAPKDVHITSFSLDKPITYRTLIESEAEYLFICSTPKRVSENVELELVADAARSDIGLVLSKCTDSMVMKNMAGILDPEATKLVTSLSRRNVAKHLYITARYNLHDIKAFDSLMVDKEKVKAAVSKSNIDDEVAINTLSKMLTKAGYRNLYNPYVKC